jgi:hypothetical protein
MLSGSPITTAWHVAYRWSPPGVRSGVPSMGSPPGCLMQRSDLVFPLPEVRSKTSPGVPINGSPRGGQLRWPHRGIIRGATRIMPSMGLVKWTPPIGPSKGSLGEDNMQGSHCRSPWRASWKGHTRGLPGGIP